MYEWLRDYQKLVEDIAYLEFSLEKTEIELKRWVEGDLQGIKLQHDSLGAKVEENIEEIKRELKFKREQMFKLVQLIETFKGLDHKVLKMKYIDGMTLENIAHDLGYSAGYIYKKHAEIIRIIKYAGKLSIN